MPHSPGAHLESMLVSIGNIARHTDGLDYDGYISNEVLVWGVERQLGNLGEALYQLEQSHPEVARQIPEHRAIVRFRHVIIHGYASVDQKRIWDLLNTELPLLRQAVEDLLARQGG